MRRPVFVFILRSWIGLSLCGCNLFSPLDRPTGDDQLLSAARICLDQADYECARNYYSKLSLPLVDIQQSELAYATFNENGLGFGVLAATLGKSPNGESLTSLSNYLAQSASLPKRLAFYSAYKRSQEMTQGTFLQRFTQFLSATILASELLAEATGADLTLEATDIAQGGKSCDATTCLQNTAVCRGPVGSGIQVNTGVSNQDLLLTEPTNPVPSLLQIYIALNKAVEGLRTISAKAGTIQIFDAFLGQNSVPSVTDTDTSTSNQCFRAALIQQGVGKS